MAENRKDTIYIDVDDEITTIIDKVRASSAGLVALVLPKRASVLQSVVNMKLLKRGAEDEGKQVVLITTEQGLLPLAGSVGVYVASSLNSKPEIPKAPEEVEDEPNSEDPLDLSDEPEDSGYDREADGNRPVGELSGAAAGAATESALAEAQQGRSAEPVVSQAPKTAKPKVKKDRHLKVPSFNKFRKRTVLAILAIIAIIVLAWLALVVLPHATIAITTDGRDINSSFDVTLDTNADQVDPASNTVPAAVVTQQKTYTSQVDTTGKVNKGDTATGSVTMTASICGGSGFPQPVPAYTGVSTGGKTYITQSDANFTNFQSYNNGCATFSSNSVDIKANSPGADYNTSGNANFTVAGRSDVSATGSADGGTDDIQTVVTQADIDNAKGKIETNDQDVQNQLTQQLQGQNLLPITATFNSGKPDVTTSAQPGDETSSVTVTEVVTYEMFGTRQANLLTLVKNDINDQVGGLTDQSILDNGLQYASYSLKKARHNSAVVSMENTAKIGPKIIQDQLKKQAAGQKSGEVRQKILQIPGVQTVDIKLSPFWLGSIPNNPDKITININKSANGS